MTEPAAGWYHDPADASAWRWWDGATWTDHIRQKDVPAHAPSGVAFEPFPTHPPVFTIVENVPTLVEPLPVSAPVAIQPDPTPVPAPGAIQPDPPTLASSIPQPGQVVGTPVGGGSVPLTPTTPIGDQMYWHSSAAEVIQVPRLNHPRTGAMRTVQRATAVPSYVRDWQDLGSPNTGGIWLLAFSPLLYIVISFVFGFVNGLGGGVFGAAAPYVVLGVFLGVCWIFAYADQRALATRGYHAPAIWWMLLLPPLVYIIARGRAVRRESMRAWPPELVFFLLFTGMVAAAVAVYATVAMVLAGALTVA